MRGSVGFGMSASTFGPVGWRLFGHKEATSLRLCLFFMFRKAVPFNIGDQKVANILLSGKLPQIDWSAMSPLAGNLIRH